MKAAVVESFEHPPRYRDFDPPEAKPGETIVSVRAAALSQLVRAQAAGRHYTRAQPPFVPGADGVGLLESGQRVYFAFPRAPVGSMAPLVAVDRANVVPIPDEVDDLTAAAIANPGMSSWAALTERAHLRPGESVLVNGATGGSGRLALGIARHLGAGRVIATGRNASSEAAMRALGADEFIPLDLPPQVLEARIAQLAEGGIDVVLDYLWGPPAEILLAALSGHAPGHAAPRVRYVNIGSLAGANISLPASIVRRGGLELLGSGIGSISNAALVRAVGGVLGAVRAARLDIEAEAMPLRDVEQAWARKGTARVVLLP